GDRLLHPPGRPGPLACARHAPCHVRRVPAVDGPAGPTLHAARRPPGRARLRAARPSRVFLGPCSRRLLAARPMTWRGVEGYSARPCTSRVEHLTHDLEQRVGRVRLWQKVTHAGIRGTCDVAVCRDAT